MQKRNKSKSSENVAKRRRKKNPTCDSLSTKSKYRRRNETDRVARFIHGSTEEIFSPALDGMIDTICTKYPSRLVAKKIYHQITQLKNRLKKSVQQNPKKITILQKRTQSDL